MNYLAISQKVAFRSGTVSSTSLPSAVTGQTGRLAQIVDFVDASWQSIQTMRPDWRWMRTEFTGAILSPTQRWSATDLSITRFSRWVFDPRPGYSSGWSMYLTATGVSDAAGTVPRFGEAIVEVPVSISLFRIAHQAVGVMSSEYRGKLAYDMSGRLAGPAFRSVRFRSSGEFTLPEEMVERDDVKQ